MLLQVLDEVSLTDSLGRKVDFKNTVIIMTSNLGARQVKDFGNGVGFGTEAMKSQEEKNIKSTIEKSLKKAFSPEFLNKKILDTGHKHDNEKRICVGMIFMPRNDYADQEKCRSIIETILLNKKYYIYTKQFNMKKMKRFIYVFITLLVFSSCNESPVDLDKAKSEAEAFIESQFDFFSSGNIEDAKKVFDLDAVLIGTDEDEYLSGWSEVGPSIVGQIAVIKEPVFKSRNLNIVMGDDGKMASYTQLIDFTFKSGEETLEITNVRCSGVIKKSDEGWKVVQIHWSMGVKGQVIEY